MDKFNEYNILFPSQYWIILIVKLKKNKNNNYKGTEKKGQISLEKIKIFEVPSSDGCILVFLMLCKVSFLFPSISEAIGL